MKEYGQVKDYNGYYGKILNEKGEYYLLIKEQILGDEIINNNDKVSFIPEEYHNEEVNEKIARLVRKLPNNKVDR